MPYPDGFNHEEKLKLAMLWGQHENYDRVRWEFAKFYEINRKPSLIPPRERRGEVPHYPGCEAVACGAVRGRNQWPLLAEWPWPANGSLANLFGEICGCFVNVVHILRKYANICSNCMASITLIANCRLYKYT